MSGICGIVNFDGKPVDPELLKKMAEAAAYRGPDGITYWIQGNVGFAHLALHTTPESVRERQPLVNRRGDIVLTADARVDNRDELIRTLTSKGYLEDKDPTDADLIMAAYECWGEACPEHVIGDFAFAIWDTRNRSLFCARDTAGARLLYYSFEPGVYRFASGIGQILADERVERDLDGYAISDFLTFNFQDQARTAYVKVQKLLHGHSLTLSHATPRTNRYWRPDGLPSIEYPKLEDYIEHFRELLFRCVADRLRSRTEVASILTSGGMDSSSIAAIAQSLYTSGQIKTRPVAYTYVLHSMPYGGERDYVRALAEKSGIELREIDTENLPLVDVTSGMRTQTIEGPTMASYTPEDALFEQYQECGSDTLIIGLGGDSLFAPSTLVQVDYVRTGAWGKLKPWLLARQKEGRSLVWLTLSLLVRALLPQRVTGLLDRLLKRNTPLKSIDWINPTFRRAAHTAHRFRPKSQKRGYRSLARQAQYEHLTELFSVISAIAMYNRQAESYRMGCSFPLLDRRLAEFMLASPLELGKPTADSKNKWLLRRAVADLLPETILKRPKTTSHANQFVNQRFRVECRSFFTELFEDMITAQCGILNEEVIATSYKDHHRSCNSRHDGAFVFPVTAGLELWMKNHRSQRAAIRFANLEHWQVAEDNVKEGGDE